MTGKVFLVGFSTEMARDDAATLAELKRVFRDVVRPAVRSHDGRIVKLLGDGALVEFPAASAALACAVRIQLELAHDPVRLRAGLHVGEITEDGGDVFGDAVNVAARLQSAASAGGVLVSRAAADMAGSVAGVTLKPEGLHSFRNIPYPIETLSADLDDRGGRKARFSRFAGAQEIRFARSSDGIRLGWTAIGEGRPIVKAPNWIQHLERDWEIPAAVILATLAEAGRLVRFDSRGNGLSDRDVADFSLDRLVDDLEAVFDAASVERAPVFGISQGCAIGCAFAARRPERVSGLIFLGGYAQGRARRARPDQAETARALWALAQVGWHDPYPSVRDHFARLIFPDISEEQQRAFAELMRDMISPDVFRETRLAVDQFDVTDLLPKIECPALVLHSQDDRLHPIDQGRMLAAGLPHARFVALPSRNHILTAHDAAWPIAEREIRGFLDHLG